MSQVTCLPPDDFKDQAAIDQLRCPIGKGVFNDPIYDECGHIFCNGCFTTAYKSKGNCPISDKKISGKTNPAPEIADKVSSLFVACKNSGNCNWAGEMRNREKHLQTECQYRKVKCTIENCGMEINFVDKTNHEERCEWRVKDCQFCKEAFKANDIQMEEHHNSNCTEIEIDCEKRCIVKYKRKHKELHDQYNCEKTKFDCYFRNAGCYFVGNWEEIGRHSSEAMLLHATFLEQKLQHFEAYRKVTERLLQDIQKDPTRYEALTKYVKEIDDTEDIDFAMFQGDWDKYHSNPSLSFDEPRVARSRAEGRDQLLWIDRKFHERHRIVFALETYKPSKGVVGLRVGLGQKGAIFEDGDRIMKLDLADSYKLFSDSAAGEGPMTIPFKEGEDYMLSYDPDTCQLILEQLNMNVEKPDEVAVEFPTEFWEFQPVFVVSGEVTLRLMDFNDWNQH